MTQSKGTREELIKEIDRLGLALTLRQLGAITTFIIADRLRIVGPLVKQRNKKSISGYGDFAVAIGETLKNAGATL